MTQRDLRWLVVAIDVDGRWTRRWVHHPQDATRAMVDLDEDPNVQAIVAERWRGDELISRLAFQSSTPPHAEGTT